MDDYYAACTNNVNNGTAAMNVYGRFTPATDYFYGCTLQDGATIDLNGRTGAWSTTSVDAASKAMGRALRVKDDGLYAVGGMMIIVR